MNTAKFRYDVIIVLVLALVLVLDSFRFGLQKPFFEYEHEDDHEYGDEYEK